MSMKPKPLQARYGRWTVIDPSVEVPAHGKVLVGCDCGTLKEVAKRALTQGASTSCGCRARDSQRAPLPDLAPDHSDEVIPGARFGRLTVLTEPMSGKNRNVQCRCDCGVVKDNVGVGHLLSRDIRSCGCLKRDTLRLRNQHTVS